MGFWADRVLPFLIEKACNTREILDERARWVPRARGEVLELGVGSGLNLPLYEPGRVARVTAIDPSSPLLARAAARAREAAVPVVLVRARAEALPFPDDAFDTVVVTYTLCSVSEPSRALAEVRRVLRPGGELVFIEHGLAREARVGRWQRRLTPMWQHLAGGCHLDRDVPALLREAGFASDELRADYTEGLRILSFTYEGRAHPA